MISEQMCDVLAAYTSGISHFHIVCESSTYRLFSPYSVPGAANVSSSSDEGIRHVLEHCPTATTQTLAGVAGITNYGGTPIQLGVDSSDELCRVGLGYGSLLSTHSYGILP